MNRSRSAEASNTSRSLEAASGQAQAMNKSRLRLILRDETGRTQLTSDLIGRLMNSLADEGVSVARFVTIEGTPGSFCEGLDLESLLRQHNGAPPTPDPDFGLGRYAALLTAIARTPRPVVALVDGAVLGGGIGLAAAADLVLATNRASFALPETLMGLIPAVVFPILASRIGVARARLLALGAKPLSASQALQIGLVDEVADDLEELLVGYARRFLRLDAMAVGTLKKLVANHFGTSADYYADASESFFKLVNGNETRSRLARYLGGETPWLDEPS